MTVRHAGRQRVCLIHRRQKTAHVGEVLGLADEAAGDGIVEVHAVYPRARVYRRDNQVVPVDANANVSRYSRTELDFVLHVRAGLPSAAASREVDGIVRDMDVREAHQVRKVTIAVVVVREVSLRPEAYGIHAGLDRMPGGTDSRVTFTPAIGVRSAAASTCPRTAA